MQYQSGDFCELGAFCGLKNRFNGWLPEKNRKLIEERNASILHKYAAGHLRQT